ncbi:transcriptional regulator [Sphingomonas sp. GCM10030256]|uniref:helix-turn-helix transcriptional regulator n=1 Tax=Sphingomonas sp. GCM10030256 TaxID=3273427 RepID=UPI003610C9A9
MTNLGAKSDPGKTDLHRQMQAKLIQDELSRRGWNQSDLGRATKLPRYTISRIVRGQIPLSREHANRIAMALDLDPTALQQLSTRSASMDLTEGVQSTAQADGLIRIRVNALVQPGIHLLVEALISHDEPIRADRISHILKAVYEPLPDRKKTSG